MWRKRIESGRFEAMPAQVRLFRKESEMQLVVARWLATAGMAVRSEFVTPWGICDLVGVAFRPRRVAQRIALRQVHPLSSLTRAALLLKIPDVKLRRAVNVSRLVRECSAFMSPEVVRRELDRLVSDRFVVHSGPGRIQKRNGWMPIQNRLVAVELKLDRVQDAIRQAANNLRFATESYVAMPTEVAERVSKSARRREQFHQAGVGLLEVTSSDCLVAIKASRSRAVSDPAVQMYCVDKFWRDHIKGNSA